MELRFIGDSMNQSILDKKIEFEAITTAEYERLNQKLVKAKAELNDVKSRFDAAQEEVTYVNHRLATIICQLAQAGQETQEAQKNVYKLEKEIDELKVKMRRAATVRAREERVRIAFHELLSSLGLSHNRFWNKSKGEQFLTETLEMKLFDMRNLKMKLIEELKSTEWAETLAEKRKLQTECMILEKRNAALEKKLTKRLEYLELLVGKSGQQ